MAYGDFARSLDPADPRQAALLNEARGVMGHAGYVAFDGAPPPQPDARGAGHDLRAHDRAHAAARRPLRARPAGRAARGPPPAPAEIDALTRLPEAMAAAGSRIGRLERAIVDEVEVRMLLHRVGEKFTAAVTDIDKRGAQSGSPIQW